MVVALYVLAWLALWAVPHQAPAAPRVPLERAISAALKAAKAGTDLLLLTGPLVVLGILSAVGGLLNLPPFLGGGAALERAPGDRAAFREAPREANQTSPRPF